MVDANLEAAQLHVLADLAQSIGVALAALVIILKPDWQIVDPMCTLLATVFGLYSTLPLIGRGFMILLEGVPSHVRSCYLYSDYYHVSTLCVDNPLLFLFLKFPVFVHFFSIDYVFYFKP